MSEQSRKAWGWIIIWVAMALGTFGATVAAIRSHQHAEQRAVQLAEKRDELDEKRAELAASTAREEALSALIFGSSSGWAVVDEINLIRDWNPVMEEMTGWTKADMIGSDLSRVMEPEVWKRHLAAYGAAINDPERRGTVQRVECDLLHKDGSTVEVEVRLQVVEGTKGPYAVALIDRVQAVVELPKSTSVSVLHHFVGADK